MALLFTSKNAPHLILGVPNNSSPNDVVAAFARKTRQVKSDPSAAFKIEDLTSALSEIQQGSADALALRYEIPCNSLVHDPTATFECHGTTHTVKDAPSELIGCLIEQDQKLRASLTILNASIHQLLEWNWPSAADLSRECLRIADDEDVRDEALNILAASLVMSDEPARALQALQKAVEGKWNLGLQANLGLVATSQDPQLAASQMSFLIDGAKTADEKVQATRAAIGLWRSAQQNELSDDDLEPLPPSLVASIHSLLKIPDLSEEAFFDIALFLARIEQTGSEFENAVGVSVHAKSPSANLIHARRKDFLSFIDAVMAEISRDSGSERPWIQRQADELVSQINATMLNEEEDSHIGINLAFRLVDKGLDCSTFNRMALRFLLMMQIHKVFEDGAEPSEKLIQWHNEAKTAIQSTGLANEQIEILEDFCARSGNTLGALTHIALTGTYQKVEQMANMIIRRMTGFMNRLTADKRAVSSVSATVVQACKEAVASYNRVIPITTEADLKNEMSKVKSYFESVLTKISAYR